MKLGLTSTEFVFLLPIVVLLYYLVPNIARRYYLLIINLLFYASFGYKYIVVIVAEALIAWIISGIVSKCRCKGKIKATYCWMISSIVALVAILLFFKIGSGFVSSIVAPLGISFYTLQAISYIADVKKGDIEPERDIVRLIIYLSFFPTITSGPICRYKDFAVDLNRICTELRAEYDRIINGIIYMLYGYFLKLVISARAGIAVDKVFGDYRTVNYGGMILFFVACLYSIQIYTDFAGYSAIVIGLAQILGFEMPENFIAPYLSQSVKEFWGRWHVSLSSWLKDYIYIPLGGNRKGRMRKYLNIMITFVVSGIWHGVTGWHFLIWGFIHGFYQVIGDLTRRIRKKIVPKIGIIEDSFFHKTIRRIVTFALVTIAWVFFRTGVSDALHYMSEMCRYSGLLEILNGGLLTTGLVMGDWIILAISALFVLCVDGAQYKKGMRYDEMVASQGVLAKCVMVITVSLVILVFGIYGDQHDASYFIYKDF